MTCWFSEQWFGTSNHHPHCINWKASENTKALLHLLAQSRQRNISWKCLKKRSFLPFSCISFQSIWFDFVSRIYLRAISLALCRQYWITDNGGSISLHTCSLFILCSWIHHRAHSASFFLHVLGKMLSACISVGLSTSRTFVIWIKTSLQFPKKDVI